MEIHLKAMESKQLVMDAKLKPLPRGMIRQGLYYGAWFWIIPLKDQDDIHYVLCNMFGNVDELKPVFSTNWWYKIRECIV